MRPDPRMDSETDGVVTATFDRSRMPFDALVLDGHARQALVTTRTLGRQGLHVATAECADLCDSRFGVPTFASRWSLRTNRLPSYHDEPSRYAQAVIDLASAQPTRVVIPSMDGSVAALRSWRSCFEQHGVALALASEAALDAANDKKRTLASAAELGIPCPRTIPIECVEDTPAALAEVGYPAVIKPTQSWVSGAGCATRVVSQAAVDESEAVRYVERLLMLGGSPVIQQMANGPREAVSVFFAHGKVWAKFAQVAYRTTPVLGGVSVVREGIPMPADLESAALALVRDLDLEGCCEVEFRRDATGRPLLMEINARMSGSIEVAIRSGVPFPALLWRWAAGEPLDVVPGYQAGIKMRYLKGDMKWLWENLERRGRQPDGVPPQTAIATFARDFLHRQSYDYMDRHDLGPAVAALAGNVNLARRKLMNVTHRSADQAPPHTLTTKEHHLVQH
jgi:predicted ATP-grasp superfamily ATP-dependent carboligase